MNGPDCVVCASRKSCFFVELKGDAFEDFRLSRVSNLYKKRQVVFYEGHSPHGIYIVCQGRVKIYKTDNKGHQLTTRVVYPGDLMGHPALLTHKAYSATAESMDDSWLAYLNEAKFRDLVTKHQVIAHRMLQHLSEDMRLAEDKARDMAMKSSRERLAEILLTLKGGPDTPFSIESRAGTENRPPVLNIPFTRLDLAEMAGLAQETVIRLMTELEEERVIAVKGRALKILDEKALRRCASLSA